MNSKEALIQKLALQAHPEDGYYKEVYRSEGEIPAQVLPPEFGGSRNYCTSIYYMLTHDTFSAFHRIKQDEIWHFYDGSAIELHVISPTGEHSQHLIGSNVLQNEQPQVVVPAGYWFAAKTTGKDYSLAGCTVAPGFSFKDFELPKREKLVKQFPQHRDVIERFTRV
jgi:predicted cupin superfamily sugar epimerase